MARSALILGAAASLGLGVLDLGYLNLHLVPTALSASAQGEDAARDALETRPDSPAASGDERAEPAPRGAELASDAEPRETEPAAAIAAAEVDTEDERTAPAPAEREPVPDLVTLHFPSDSDELSSRALRRVERVAGHLAADDGLRVVITGHADERGTDEYNDGLALGRARSVAAAFERHGVARDRIETRSLGEARPVTTGRDAASLRENRRVEIAMERGQP